MNRASKRLFCFILLFLIASFSAVQSYTPLRKHPMPHMDQNGDPVSFLLDVIGYMTTSNEDILNNVHIALGIE